MEAVEALETKERARGWKISALRALETLSHSKLLADKPTEQKEAMHRLLNESSILELNGLSQSTKAFLIPILCLWLYYVKLSSTEREKLSLVILIEEAHHVLYSGNQKHESLMEMLLRQCRELGMCFIVVDQHPSLISRAALGNVYTTICLNLKDSADINKAAAVSLLDKEEKHYLSMLPIGQGIVKLQDRWRKPCLVQFPLVSFKKGAISDEYLREYFDNSSCFRRSIDHTTSTLGLLSLNDKHLGTFGRSPTVDNVFTEEAVMLIKDVLQYTDSGVDARYKRLGMSVERGNRLKNQLVKAGVLEGLEVPVERTRKLVLRPTAKAREELGFDKGELTRESIAHEYWKRYYARLFKEKGYQVTLEASRRNGRVDVLALKPGENGTRAAESVAIEIETGKSDAVWNVKQDILSGFGKVLVVATGQEALRIVESQLAKAGLLGVSKVKVVFQAQIGNSRESRRA